MARLAKRDFERKIAKNIKKDSRTFFKYAQSKTKVKSTVGPLLDDNDELTCHDNNMGQMLNAFFASMFTTECVEELPDCTNSFQGNGENKFRNYHVGNWTLRLRHISPTSHFAYDMDTSPTGYFAYWTVRLRDSSPTRHFAYDMHISPTQAPSQILRVEVTISKLDRTCKALPVVANFVALERQIILVKTRSESV